MLTAQELLDMSNVDRSRLRTGTPPYAIAGGRAISGAFDNAD